MNVTPAERRGSVAKTTSCTLLACLFFLFIFFSFSSSFLVFLSLSRLLQVDFSTVEHLTHEDGPLCNVPGCVQSLLVSLAVPRKPFVGRRRRLLSATSRCHQSPVTSVLVVQRKMVGSINEIICMPRVRAMEKNLRD